MLQALVITCPVRCDASALYGAFWHPEAFARWASGLAKANLRQTARGWTADGPDGPIRITFTAHNPFGVMDHWVTLADGAVIAVPMRIVPNAEGSEVMLTLFRQPGMTDAKFAEDADWITRDLAALKSLAEQDCAAKPFG